MYVEALSEGSRTRVRFPPPPPIFQDKALVIKGLFYFDPPKNFSLQTLFRFSEVPRYPLHGFLQVLQMTVNKKGKCFSHFLRKEFGTFVKSTSTFVFL